MNDKNKRTLFLWLLGALNLTVSVTGLVSGKLILTRLSAVMNARKNISDVIFDMKAMIETYADLFYWFSISMLILTFCWMLFLRQCIKRSQP